MAAGQGPCAPVEAPQLGCPCRGAASDAPAGRVRVVRRASSGSAGGGAAGTGSAGFTRTTNALRVASRWARTRESPRECAVRSARFGHVVARGGGADASTPSRKRTPGETIGEARCQRFGIDESAGEPATPLGAKGGGDVLDSRGAGRVPRTPRAHRVYLRYKDDHRVSMQCKDANVAAESPENPVSRNGSVRKGPTWLQTELLSVTRARHIDASTGVTYGRTNDVRNGGAETRGEWAPDRGVGAGGGTPVKERGAPLRGHESLTCVVFNCGRSTREGE